MQISDLTRMLVQVKNHHGDIRIFCGNHSIAGIAIRKVAEESVATILLKKPLLEDAPKN